MRFKKIVAVLLAMLLTVGWATPFLADTPFQGYTYNYWAALVPSPAAYVPARSFTAADVCPTLVSFVDPTDIHVCPNGMIFIVDSGNHRVVVFDQRLNLLHVITGFYRDGEFERFNRPNGVFVTPEGEIFVADTLNERIAVLDSYGNFIREIVTPEIEGLDERLIFRPLYVVVDRGGRTLVIVQHVFEGIMNFDATGQFVGYFGTIEVGRNWIEIFWRFFMTDRQIQNQNRFIPTEFQSMALDDRNFVFTTNLDPWGSANQIMRLNPRGEDVILNINESVTLSGDQRHRTIGSLAGPSQLIDVIARPHGKVTALDSTRGRVYTYDAEGNLLYVFSGWGSIEGMTRRPVAIEVIGDDILILDAHMGRIIQFTPTEYGALINEAIRLRDIGDEAGAVDAWRRLTALDENFELAWAGIGRSMLAEGNHAAAMYYLRRGMDLIHFSIAFRRHRLDVMQNILPTVFTVGTALIGLFIVYKIGKHVRNRVVEA
ncbi:MAG: NHL repeat-containing protein [Defluviitaleaceae bacterium]|nr:NHL repeat-containing protein [Defluviitaleaceae bacterium]MCL2273764.1 NHL repeat-containing protein [Defluviitaleaceae bacterium]